MMKGNVLDSNGIIIEENVDISLNKHGTDNGMSSWDGYFCPPSGVPYIAANGPFELVLNNKSTGKMLVKRVRLNSNGRSRVEFQGTGTPPF